MYRLKATTLWRSLLLASAVVAAQPSLALQAWSTMGSGGTLDEDSVGKYTLNGAGVSVNKNAAPATVTVRYPIEDLWGANPSPVWIGARFTDNGADSHVVIKLMKLTIGTASAVVLATWDSDAFAPGEDTQFFWLKACPLEALDFTSNTYYFEAAVTKSTAAAKSGLSMIRLDNFSGCTAESTRADEAARLAPR